MGIANQNQNDSENSQSDDPLDGDWFETDHKRVFYAQNLAFSRGEIEDAKEYAERFESWYIVITCRPYLSYDISYEIRPQHGAIHLDYYSPRPGVGLVDDIGDNIQRGIQELREAGVIDDER
jgi:hypothetical protein